MSFRRSLTFLFVNCAVFAGGMEWAFHRAQPVLGTPVISYLLSRSKNPSGYPIAAFALIFSALFLAASASGLPGNAPRRLVRAGCVGLFVMAVLAFFVESLGSLHDALSAVTLIGLLLGVAFGIASLHAAATKMGRIVIWTALGALLLLVLLLVDAYIDTGFFNNSSWWRNLAEAEWALIAVIDAALAAILITAQRRSQRRT
ncbi:hypothetical protein [Terriglobus saanensis]|uniref:DUF998 domain-containing protein n=1 Tax=Terriglobus saanensis (strain ATCC BAA-1853 / DSM 23119 / SP1PR4) TaxID=401053 RepID=E8V7H1_TERSS|nr:hypothetical protein [Terriglobus saanensis]ADV83945.1 hypothetical protein AciPR4_3189 [Terriglobus saanensis SP1PR4]